MHFLRIALKLDYVIHWSPTHDPLNGNPVVIQLSYYVRVRIKNGVGVFA
jgi:hypothetical protein